VPSRDLLELKGRDVGYQIQVVVVGGLQSLSEDALQRKNEGPA
jgi:hypothetical protein